MITKGEHQRAAAACARRAKNELHVAVSGHGKAFDKADGVADLYDELWSLIRKLDAAVDRLDRASR